MRPGRRVMTMEEFEADKANWIQDKVIKPKGSLLKLSATEAEQLGLARFIVDDFKVMDPAHPESPPAYLPPPSLRTESHRPGPVEVLTGIDFATVISNQPLTGSAAGR